jgi:hypothetical protein
MSRQILHIIMTAFQSAVEYSWFPAADIVDSIVANNSQTVYCPGQLYKWLNRDFPNSCLGIRPFR